MIFGGRAPLCEHSSSPSGQAMANNRQEAAHGDKLAADWRGHALALRTSIEAYST
jgi:hypothetical protein